MDGIRKTEQAILQNKSWSITINNSIFLFFFWMKFGVEITLT